MQTNENGRRTVAQGEADGVRIVVRRGSRWARPPNGTLLWGIELGHEEWTASTARRLGRREKPTAGLRAAAEKLLYEAVRDAWPAAETTAAAIARGRKIDVVIAPPEPMLTPWDTSRRRLFELKPELIGKTAIVVPAGLGPVQQALLAEAMERAEESRLLHQENEHCRGLEWYDRLRRIERVDVLAVDGNDRRWVGQPGRSRRGRVVEVVDKLFAHVRMLREGRPVEPVATPIDIAFERAGEENEDWSRARLVVAAERTRSAEALAAVAERALVRPRPGRESAAERRLRERLFGERIRFEIRNALEGPRKAAEAAIVELVNEHAEDWIERIPQNARAPIRIEIDTNGEARRLGEGEGPAQQKG